MCVKAEGGAKCGFSQPDAGFCRCYADEKFPFRLVSWGRILYNGSKSDERGLRMRLLTLLLILLLPLWALCEASAEPPATLPAATSVEDAEAFLLLPTEDALADVQRGHIRYIGQNAETDEYFRAAYWQGDEPGSPLDLTLTERYGAVFPFHAMNMCSRAIYSMALSYLGVDLTPGGMSALMGQRDLPEPYDGVSALVGVERLSWPEFSFNEMMENYLTDPDYSPVYLYIRRPDGTAHALLVIATIPEKSRYIVLDCNPPRMDWQRRRVYFISLNRYRTAVINSAFYEALAGSEVLQVHQWRLTESAQ